MVSRQGFTDQLPAIKDPALKVFTQTAIKCLKRRLASTGVSVENLQSTAPATQGQQVLFCDAGGPIEHPDLVVESECLSIVACPTPPTVEFPSGLPGYVHPRQHACHAPLTIDFPFCLPGNIPRHGQHSSSLATFLVSLAVILLPG